MMSSFLWGIQTPYSFTLVILIMSSFCFATKQRKLGSPLPSRASLTVLFLRYEKEKRLRVVYPYLSI